jgi:hypothetical protein
MASKIKVDQIQTGDGTGTIALQNQLSGMTHASVPTLTGGHMPTGSVLQVVQATSTTQNTTTSTSFVAASLNASITPIATNSKILVTVAGGAMDYGSAAQIQIHLYRSIGGGSYSDIRDLVRTSLGSPTWSLSHSYNYLDSPNTTSAVTYKPYYKTSDSSKSMLFNNSYAIPITMTLQEIAG